MTHTLTPAVDAALTELLTTFGAADANAAQLLVDRHDPSAVAFTQVDVDAQGELVVTDLTYGHLADQSKRLATALAARGVQQGDTVGVLMGKRAELVVSLLAIARLGAVYIPLFTAFATPAIEMRLTGGDAKVVITEDSQVAKLDGIGGITTIVTGAGSEASGPQITGAGSEASGPQITGAGSEASGPQITGAGSEASGPQITGARFDDLIAESEPIETSVAVGGDAPLVLIFTSGTTGAPKGVPVPVRSLAAFAAYLTYGLDVRADDVFWNAADPGWAYGLYYGILGPMAAGRRNILLHAGFSAAVTAKLITELGVTNFAAAPTVYRSIKTDPAIAGFHLRRASSAGEPLTPDVITWSVDALGTEVRDHYGQTEHGMFVNNHWHDDLRKDLVPGSMGYAMPGFSVDVVDGQIAIDTTASPLLWFTGYLDAPEKTAQRYTGDGRWYLTGDTGRKDEEDRFFFTARDDDVIIMAGYRIGPFDVESVLITHPSVIDVAVVGRPDELRGEVLEAFVVTAEGVVGDAALEAELQQLVKTGFAAHAYPRTVHFVDSLPKTPSGKVQRFLLRQR